MESTISKTLSLSSSPSSSLNPVVFRLHRYVSRSLHRRCLPSRLIAHRLSCIYADRIRSPGLSPAPSLSPPAPVRFRLRCVSSSAAPFGAFGGHGGGGGSGGGGGGGGRGGGGGGVDGEDGKAKSVVDGAEEASAVSSDVIILDVGGMTCGGCAASVKRILENQPKVSAASVNLTTETAIVWPVSEAKAVPNWQKELGETLAKHLTNCGFKSNPRDAGGDNFFKVFERKMNEKHDRLKESGRQLAVSWALCAVCLLGHLSHFFGAKAPWIHAFHSTGFHLSLSLFTLIGPGRGLISDGLRNLLKGAPNMNTLVGLGALSSFCVSTLAALVPKLGWKAFFEEPVMLVAFVLLGRNLEQRAKIKATSDMTGLLSILPSKARLLVSGDEDDLGSIVEVPCNTLSVGDQIVILPGDRVPADGVVRAGRSTVNESSFTGEPLPATKLPGVSGHFTYGVMALSAATFVFWNVFGSRILPAALNQGSSVSLALQLSCSVLVVACPCALGLATPTAVLIGTSLGATKGLLLRGGSVLEKFSMVNTIVFDKTGTLTVGKPIVTKVVTPGCAQPIDSRHNSDDTWSEVEVLQFAAGVESNTIHPVGKAIVEAAQARNCPKVKVLDGTYIEEPGSGAAAVINNKKVSVGNLEWIRRHGVDADIRLMEEPKNQSVVYVGVDNSLAGLIYIEDQIREDARHVVSSLSGHGVDVYMLSGDRRSTADYVASMVGIPLEKVISGVKPDQKKKFISELQQDDKIVAMVGDGINDAAALASSHVGVAMGGGVGAASEVSSVVLMGNRLSQLLDALELSQLTMKTIKQNLWWAFAYNIVGIPIAAGVLLPMTGITLTPSIAGALMGLSSIGVMANSLLLRLRFSSKQNKISRLPSTMYLNTADQKEEMKRFTNATWREAR
ncbi:hypothetical protein BT93_G0651 [Corymbia citriodora subsp. variegata]|nr:hypothetical protein BT93_G0651 [Corymbia citriodora subsp. variegata]